MALPLLTSTPPLILQDLRTFSTRIQEVWRDGAFRPPEGLYTLSDAIVQVTYTENRYGPVAHVSVVEYLRSYP